MNKNNLITTMLIVLMTVGTLTAIGITARNNLKTATPLSFETYKALEKNYVTIELSAKDFYGGQRYIRAIVFFEDKVKVVLKDVEIIYDYRGLNAIEALLPVKLYRFLQQAWFVTCISEVKDDSSLPSFLGYEERSSASSDSFPFQPSHHFAFFSDLEDALEPGSGPTGVDQLSWGVDWINAERVWGGEEDATDVLSGHISGEGIKIGIIDSGIDYYHLDLSDNYAGGVSFVDGVTSPRDTYGHGTHVAGIVAAVDNDITSVIGVAPKSSLYAIKVGGWTYFDFLTSLIKGINWAVEHDLDIINLSLGIYEDEIYYCKTENPEDLLELLNALEVAVNRAYNHGIVLVAAAGNRGDDDVAYPARFDNVIAVSNLAPVYSSGSSEPYDVELHSSSSYGPWIDFCAPGTNILSTFPGQTFVNGTGTSMAAPMVTGVCALILDVNPNFSPADVKNILIDSCEDIGDEGFDEYYGHGQVRAKEAVDEAITTSPSDSDGDGLPDRMEIRVTGTDPYDPDTDNDGLSDGFEINIYGTDPLNSDTDYDTLNDGQEYSHGTNPFDPDTDGDDMNDGWEVRHALDPNDPSDASLDPDNDGLTNLEEYNVGTDPHSWDTDGDGYSDSFELNPSYPYDPTPSDPTDPNSVPTISGFSRW